MPDFTHMTNKMATFIKYSLVRVIFDCFYLGLDERCHAPKKIKQECHASTRKGCRIREKITPQKKLFLMS